MLWDLLLRDRLRSLWNLAVSGYDNFTHAKESMQNSRFVANLLHGP